MNRRKILQLLIGLSVISVVVFTAWYLSSSRFNHFVRARIIRELEDVTGGTVEIKSLRWNLSRLEFEADDLTIHGLEKGNQAPFMHIDSLHIRAKITSLLGREIGLRRVVAERPVVHIVVYPDGSTNQPMPKNGIESHHSPIDRLFDLAIDRLELHRGELLWDQQRIPLELTANDVAVGITYTQAARRYDGQLNIGKLDGKFRDYRPVSSTAEIHFSLTPTQAELKSIKWNSGPTRAEASGRITDFNHPRLETSYKLRVDLHQIGSVTRVRELQAGVMELDGSATYSSRELSSAGRVFFRGLAWQQPGVKLANANVGADFSLKREQISLSHLEGDIFGGTIAGNIELKNWLGSSTDRASTVPTGVAHLRVSALQIAPVVAAISTPSLPFERLNAVGSTDGSVDASWSGTFSRTRAQLSFVAKPPAQFAPNQLPVHAQFQGTYDGTRESLNVHQLQLATRGTQLNAAGVLAPNSQLLVEFTTSDLAEFAPALAVVHLSQLPAELKGRASFKGTVSGNLRTPRFVGHLQVSDFNSLLAFTTGREWLGAKRGTPGSAAKRVHWDLLSAEVDVGSDAGTVRKGSLRRGDAQISFELAASLHKYHIAEDDPFRAALKIKNASVADVQEIAGLNYPVEGTLNSDLNLSGTKLDQRATGHIQVGNGTAYGQQFDSLSSDLNFASSELQLKNVNAIAHQGHVTGSAAYNVRSEAFRFDLLGSDLKLADLQWLQTGKVRVSGIAEFHAQGSGTTAQPVLNGSLQLRQVVVNEETIGDVEAQAATRGTALAISARSHFQGSELTAAGSVQLHGDFPADIQVKFARLDFDPLLRTFLQRGITQHSSSEGSASIQGPLRRPKELRAVADIRQFRLDVEGIALENRGPMRFNIANQRLNIENLQIVGESTDLTASGGLPLSKTGVADLRANGRVNLKLVQSFNPDLLAYGLMTLALNVRGDISKPNMSGTVQISNAGISFIDLPNGLSDINGTLTFNEDRLQVQTLTARTGGGVLNLGGFVSYSNGLFANLTAKGNDIRLRYPPGVSAVADTDLRFVGNTKNSTLSGEVTVTKFGLNPRFDFALYLARSNQPPTVPNPDSPLNNLQLDVHVVSTPELQVQTSLAKISGDADLRLRGTGTRPVVLGRVNVVEGDIFFNATKYHLDRGDILFSNPVRIEPVLNLEASARVRDVDITLGFHGPADHLTTTYRSDPPLPTADIIALLAVGRTREEAVLNQQPAPNLTETASNALLAQAADAIVSSRVQRLFGVSRIKIDPQVGGPENNPNARLTLEQQVSDKVTLTYITNISQSAQQIIQVEVQVNKRVSIVAVRDQNGVVGFDLKIRQRKW